MKPIICALDGYLDHTTLMNQVAGMESLRNLVSFVKINDANYSVVGAPRVVQDLRGAGWDVFNDLKIGDVSNTCENVFKRFFDNNAGFQLATVSSLCSKVTWSRLATFGCELALVSCLTDWSIDETYDRRGKYPLDILREDMVSLIDGYFNYVVCSAHEVTELKKEFPGFRYIVPGIRDIWMTGDHQRRTVGIYEALDRGADLVVMGKQLLGGNPACGITAEESRDRTLMEVRRFDSRLTT